jgi:hypothetical protein
VIALNAHEQQWAYYHCHCHCYRYRGYEPAVGKHIKPKKLRCCMAVRLHGAVANGLKGVSVCNDAPVGQAVSVPEYDIVEGHHHK